MQLSVGFMGCNGVLNGRVSLSDESRLVSGSRACPFELNSSQWLDSACCNPSLLYDQCCIPSNLFVNSKSIQSLANLDTVSGYFRILFFVWVSIRLTARVTAERMCCCLAGHSFEAIVFIRRDSELARKLGVWLQSSSQDGSLRSCV